MVEVLKQVGAVACERDRLKMEVRASASSKAHDLSARLEMLPGPAALLGVNSPHCVHQLMKQSVNRVVWSECMSASSLCFCLRPQSGREMG